MLKLTLTGCCLFLQESPDCLVWQWTSRIFFFLCSVGLLFTLVQHVLVALGALHAVCADDAGGPVEVEHHDQLLPLWFQLLDLRLQLRVQRLQALRLLEQQPESVWLIILPHRTHLWSCRDENTLRFSVTLFYSVHVIGVNSRDSSDIYITNNRIILINNVMSKSFELLVLML